MCLLQDASVIYRSRDCNVIWSEKKYQKIARFQSLLHRYIICEQTCSQAPQFWKINMKIRRAWYLPHVSDVKSREGLTMCGHAQGSEQQIE